MVGKVVQELDIQPIHPFPARMAPSIVWENLPVKRKNLVVLDPMAGSGTTLVTARAKGLQGIGCDTDPLAINIAHAWCSDFHPGDLRDQASTVLENAKLRAQDLNLSESYPLGCDTETRNFIDFWFDTNSRCQLSALSHVITNISDMSVRRLLWCALSRLIITKISGVSLAIDVSHSRPHKKYEKAPVSPFEKFKKAVDYIVSKAPFTHGESSYPKVILHQADARKLPLASESVDIIITSPPYLNAIDYIRGHKLSLVWMGYSLKQLRSIRSGNIGTEALSHMGDHDAYSSVLSTMTDTGSLDPRKLRMITRYLSDMERVLAECRRVSKRRGSIILVVGNSTSNGVFIRNSEGLIQLGQKNGLTLSSQMVRPLESNRRYLPPPTSDASGNNIKNRMREEVILQFNLC